jgi:acetyltransferase-like isoleucine patch superfamily enzyme
LSTLPDNTQVPLASSVAPESAVASAQAVGPRRGLIVSALTCFLPWPLRRWLLNSLCGYSIDRRARIGMSLLGCTSVRMEAGSRVGHFNVIKGARLVMGEEARLGDFNWISALPLRHPRHFREEAERDPALIVERHAAVTSRHFIDCSNTVTVGEFATVAGARSQILTHAIDFKRNRQTSAPVRIGRYCFVGTACVVLKGSRLPDYSILAASSCLNRSFEETFSLYSGTPAARVKDLDR